MVYRSKPANLASYGGFRSEYLEVRCTSNLLSNCSYKPSIFRVTVAIGFIVGL